MGAVVVVVVVVVAVAVAVAAVAGAVAGGNGSGCGSCSRSCPVVAVGAAAAAVAVVAYVTVVAGGLQWASRTKTVASCKYACRMHHASTGAKMLSQVCCGNVRAVSVCSRARVWSHCILLACGVRPQTWLDCKR